jgi:hypothetical protein
MYWYVCRANVFVAVLDRQELGLQDCATAFCNLRIVCIKRSAELLPVDKNTAPEGIAAQIATCGGSSA